jgi:hypothetical protein
VVIKHRPLQDPPKFTQIKFFGLKICHLATLFVMAAECTLTFVCCIILSNRNLETLIALSQSVHLHQQHPVESIISHSTASICLSNDFQYCATGTWSQSFTSFCRSYLPSNKALEVTMYRFKAWVVHNKLFLKHDLKIDFK